MRRSRSQRRGLDPGVLLRVDGPQDCVLDAGAVHGEAVAAHEGDGMRGLGGIGGGGQTGGEGGAEVGIADEHVLGVAGPVVLRDVEDGGGFSEEAGHVETGLEWDAWNGGLVRGSCNSC